jgi:hypothetical protein
MFNDLEMWFINRFIGCINYVEIYLNIIIVLDGVHILEAL